MEEIVTFGQWVKLHRKSLDLTQDQLAWQVGCSSAAIRKIEANERRPSRQIAQILARRLQLAPEQGDIFVRVARGEMSLERLTLPRSAAPQSEYRSLRPPQSLIPHPATPLIGRERELADIIRIMQDPHCRLLTLTGIGGTGKTRLSIEAALKLRTAFPDGAYFSSLAGIDSPALIVRTIGNALGVAFSGPMDPKKQLFHFLLDRQALLVIDNLEHLVDGVDLFGELLQFAPGIKILATSREQLHLQAEWVFEVRGLSVPQDTREDTIETSSAVRLFLQRATQSGFQISPEDFPAVARICRLVQGLPLAIELAARWTRALTCAEIAWEIERGLGLLVSSPNPSASHGSMDRHRSLQAVFDHSWVLLNSEEQRVLKQLAVFKEGFKREAAERVAGANLHLLSALIDKSLLGRASANRYGLHELVRQYLGARLAGDPREEAAARGRHSRYYLDLLSSREPALRNRQQTLALRELDEEVDNIRLAWKVALNAGLFDLVDAAAGPLYYYYELHQNFREAEALYGHAVDTLRGHIQLLDGDSIFQARLALTLAGLQNFQAFFNLRLGNNRESLALFEKSLTLLQTNPGPFHLAFALIHLGVVHWAMGNFEQALLHLKEGLAQSRLLDQAWLRALAMGFLGAVTHDLGNYPGAYAHLRESMQVFKAMGDPYLFMFMGIYYTRTLLELNRPEEAREILQEGLSEVKAADNRWLTALGMEYLARIARSTGDDPETQRLLSESVELHRQVGDPWSLALALLELSRDQLQRGDFANSEKHALEALGLTVSTGSTPISLESLMILATLCARQGQASEALTLLETILQHPASKQATRDQAECLRSELAASDTGMDWEAARSAAQPSGFAALMQNRFGLRITLPA